MTDKWDLRFFRLACEVAGWSKNPRNKVGAVLVSPDKQHFAVGYNGLPKGIADTDERLNDKAVENQLSLHAEMNAIINAAQDLAGWTMYVTKAPCTSRGCSQATIQAGIVRVVRPAIMLSSSWAQDCQAGASLMAEAGIQVDEMPVSLSLQMEFPDVLG